MCCSDQWDVQVTIQRLVASLQKRGYVVWFGASSPVYVPRESLIHLLTVCADLERMKGSVVDA